MKKICWFHLSHENVVKINQIIFVNFTDIMLTTIQLDVSMVYSLQVTCSESYYTSMETKIIRDFKNTIYQTWNTLCSSSDCSGVSIKPSCVPDSKQMMVGIQIKSLRFGMHILIFFFTCIYKLFFSSEFFFKLFACFQ